MRSRSGLFACALLALVPCAAAAPAAAQRQKLDVGVFARIGDPGQPEPIVIGDDGRVYVGTNQQQRGDSRAPSKVFAFTTSGSPVREYELKGQKLDADHGIQGLVFDGSGLLYALDRAAAPRVVTIDRASGRQADYASFRDVPSCRVAGRSTDCSATTGDLEAGPDYAAFGQDGSLYVTDIDQALIWRVPKGGGSAEVWFTDPRLESIFGPNGIQFMADGKTLLFATTAGSPANGDPTPGALWTLPVSADGRPGELRQFWKSRPFDGPDGFAIARSGNVYLALAGANQLALISPQGAEVARVPGNPIENAARDVPFDAPASVAFLGESVLVSNQSFPAGNRSHWVIFDVFAGEPGLPLFRPLLTRPRLALRLSSRFARTRRGRRRCARSRVRATVTGRDRRLARRADFLRGRRRVARDRRPPLSKIVDRARHHGRSHTHTVRVRVRMSDGSLVRLGQRYRVCASSRLR